MSRSPASAPSSATVGRSSGLALRFRLGGVPVHIEPSFLLFAALLGASYGASVQLLAWVAVVIFAVLLHEFGHAIAFRAFGQQPHVRLTMLVGLTTGSGRLSRGQDVVTRLAGPFIGLAAGGVLIVAVDGSAVTSEFWRAALSDLRFAMIGWSLLNLLPILPLDGGGVVAALLGEADDVPRQRIAHILSAVVAAAAALGAFSIQWIYPGLLASFLCYSNVSAITSGRRGQTLVAAG
ncbi:MAG: hypothetical protein LC789_18685, partial [Actinobacteria bacterium]|nr:hypothetical protein [Actinomycetota bacterium]